MTDSNRLLIALAVALGAFVFIIWRMSVRRSRMAVAHEIVAWDLENAAMLKADEEEQMAAASARRRVSAAAERSTPAPSRSASTVSSRLSTSQSQQSRRYERDTSLDPLHSVAMAHAIEPVCAPARAYTAPSHDYTSASDGGGSSYSSSSSDGGGSSYSGGCE